MSAPAFVDDRAGAVELKRGRVLVRVAPRAYRLDAPVPMADE